MPTGKQKTSTLQKETALCQNDDSVCLSYANIKKFGFDSKAKNRMQLTAQWKDTEIWGSRGCDLSDLCLLGECDAV